MGACALGNEYQTNNKAENLFISVIYNFNELNDFSAKDFMKLFQNIKSVHYEKKNENTIEEKETYLSVRYKDFKAKLIDKSNSLNSFHERLFPSFDSLFDLYIQDNPEYNILVFAFPYLREKNKFKALMRCLVDVGVNPTLREILKFIDKMIHETLVCSTKRLVEYIKKLKIGVEIVDTEYIIDNEFKELAKLSLEFYEKQEFFSFIKFDILSSLSKSAKNRIRLNNRVNLEKTKQFNPKETEIIENKGVEGSLKESNIDKNDIVEREKEGVDTKSQKKETIIFDKDIKDKKEAAFEENILKNSDKFEVNKEYLSEFDEDIELDRNDLDHLNSEFRYIFNPLDLRKHVWNNIIN